MKVTKRLLSLIIPAVVIVVFLYMYMYFGTLPKSSFKAINVFQLCENQASNSEVVNDNKTKNVLLLAYGRSGSSFTGELLSADDDTFYVFEPSFEYQQSRKVPDSQKTLEILNDIYNCKNETLTMIAINHVGTQGVPFFFPKMPTVTKENFNDVIKKCKAARIRVIKTIRLSMEHAEQLLLTKPALNLTIVHLVRDPRGMVNSMDGKWFWGKDYVEKISSCAVLRKDLKDSERIQKGKYFRVRYEDLSTEVLKTAAKLYCEIGFPLTDNLASFIAEHTHSEKITVKDKKDRYFSTFRTSDFDPNHWKKSLSSELRTQIESHCKDVMEQLNYEPQVP